MIEGFKFAREIQLRYSDFDMMEHLNNAAYSTFFELARVDYHMDILKWDFQTDVTNVVANVNINFKLPLLPNDHPKVFTRISEVGNSSFVFEYILAEETDDQPAKIFATGSTVQVCFNQQTQMPISIPEVYKQRMLEFDNPNLK